MTPQDKKAAIAAYKERKPAFGVFAAICGATGEAWVGCSRNVDTHQNQLWFTLRQGGCRHVSLQAAWREHGEGEFRYEELDRLREDYPEIGRMDELKRRQALWRERLRAEAI
jgi:hypothetical protein